MISGIVRFYNSERGFGIIRRLDGEKDVRFLLGALQTAGLGRISEGQKLKFELQAHSETGKITARLLELE